MTILCVVFFSADGGGGSGGSGDSRLAALTSQAALAAAIPPSLASVQHLTVEQFTTKLDPKVDPVFRF